MKDKAHIMILFLDTPLTLEAMGSGSAGQVLLLQRRKANCGEGLINQTLSEYSTDAA